MFSHRLDDETVLVLRTPAITEAYHALLTINQDRLARWEPWAAQPLTLEGTRSFLEAGARGWIEGSQLPVAIALASEGEWRLVGSATLRIDRYARTGEVGYWVDGAHERQGLASRAVAALLDEAFGPRMLDKVTLQTETGNARSRSLARRLGFAQGSAEAGDRVRSRTARRDPLRPARVGVARTSVP